MDFVDHLLPCQHVLVGVNLWRFSHGRALRLDQSTSCTNKARTSKGSLVEVFSIQGVRVSIVRPTAIKFSDHRVARDEAYRFREIEDMPNRLRSVVSPIFRGFFKCLIGVMSCSMVVKISQLCAGRSQSHSAETSWAML